LNVLSTSPFSPEHVAQLGGPEWLVAARVSAAERFAARAFPTTAEENWRYGNIGDLEIERFGPATGIEGVADPSPSPLEATVASPSAIVHTLDGRVTSITNTFGGGLEIVRLVDDSGPLLPGPARSIAEGFVDLAEAILVDGVVITVAPDVEVPGPVLLVHDFSGAARPTAVGVRTSVILGADASAVVVEHLRSGPGELLVLPVTEVTVAEGARCVHQIVQELDRGSWVFAYQASLVEESGSFRSFAAALGGGYARLLTRSALAGERASSELLAVYFGSGNQVQHFVTEQEHEAPRTRSELVFKGAVADAAQSIYTGLVHMVKGARKSDASQTNRNLVLGPDAHAFSVPNLDIEENDVRCSHASAVGPIDPNQVFYLESRGVHPEVAERLILLGFFDDLLSRVTEPASAGLVRAAVAESLGHVAIDLDGSVA
jgi:Fe-S cluster assembly protein SufD